MNRPSPIPTTPSRRGFLAVLSAGAASAVIPAALAAPIAPVTETALSGLPASMLGLPCADAELFNLLEAYLSAAVEQRRLYKVFDKFEAESFRLYQQQPIPDVLRQRPEDVELGLPKLMANESFYQKAHEVDHLRGKRWLHGNLIVEGDRSIYTSLWTTPSSAARARADEIIAAYSKWIKRCDRLPRGYRAAERAKNAAEGRLLAIERKIRGTRTRSLAGLIAKARMGHVLDDKRFAVSLAADLLALDERGLS